MATTKQDQSLSVEQRLSNLYQLQTILSEIDRIRTIRGELPLEVKDLEDNIEGLRTRIDNYKKEIEELRRATAAENASIAEAKSKIDKYSPYGARSEEQKAGMSQTGWSVRCPDRR